MLAPTLAACGVTGELAVRALVPGTAGLERVLALTTLASGALVACVVVPGAFGLLRPLALPVTALVLLAVVARMTRPAPPPSAPRARARAHARVAAARAPRRCSLAGCAIALLRTLAGAPISSIDAQNFQVPIPARWIQTHSIWGLHQFIADYSNATYPQNGNALIAAVMRRSTRRSSRGWSPSRSGCWPASR